MVYYVIENRNGFEELVFKGTMEEAESQKSLLEERQRASQEGRHPEWPRVKYYVFPETEWRMEIGTMH